MPLKKTLGFHGSDEMHSSLKVNRTFDDLETGKISEEAFYEYMHRRAPSTNNRTANGSLE